jgi:hypothetical protein
MQPGIHPRRISVALPEYENACKTDNDRTERHRDMRPDGNGDQYASDKEQDRSYRGSPTQPNGKHDPTTM